MTADLPDGLQSQRLVADGRPFAKGRVRGGVGRV